MDSPTQIRFTVSVWESGSKPGMWAWIVDLFGSPLGSGHATTEKLARKAANDALDAVIRAATNAKVKA